MKMQGLIIGLDFDGTVTTHEYPNIGKALPNCIKTLKRCVSEGAKICLNTMRCGKELEEAVEHLKKNGVELYGVNCNPDQKSWTESTKVYAQIYIDDAALGCPLMHIKSFHHRPHVDWHAVEILLFD